MAKVIGIDLFYGFIIHYGNAYCRLDDRETAADMYCEFLQFADVDVNAF